MTSDPRATFVAELLEVLSPHITDLAQLDAAADRLTLAADEYAAALVEIHAHPVHPLFARHAPLKAVVEG